MSAVEVLEYEQRGWDLSELLPDAAEATVDRELAEVEALVSAFEARRDSLSSSIAPRELLGWLERYQELVERMFVLGAYGSLWFSADTQSAGALSYRNRMDNALTGFENRILFFTLWWKALDDADAERVLPDAEPHSDFRHFLADLRRFKPYTLEESSEQIVNIKNANGIQAVLTLYSMLTNRLEFELEVEGETQILTRDQITSYAFSPSAELREAAYRELLRVYGREATVLGQIYVNRVRDWSSEFGQLRGFGSPIDVRNTENDVPDEAVETLLAVVGESAEIFRRYFRLKASWLGIEKLRRYDLYAPLAESERRVSYREGVSKVLSTFADFNADFADRAERVFKDDHIDSEIRKRKRSGGFCATVLPRQTPWLLVNFTGRVRDMATLAHELGHAVHSMMAEDHSILTQHASLPLAETASVFGEMLLTDRLLKEEPDPQVRRELLASSVDDIYATVMRQAHFVRFEMAAHQAILDGGPVERLNEIFMGTLVDQFGDSVEVPPEFAWEWVMIPHLFHSPFYCYSYSFGQLLVLALYRRYREQGESFVPGYLELLAAGGSARPAEILAAVGVDITDADFWRGGFEVVGGMVDELESLTVPLRANRRGKAR